MRGHGLLGGSAKARAATSDMPRGAVFVSRAGETAGVAAGIAAGSVDTARMVASTATIAAKGTTVIATTAIVIAGLSVAAYKKAAAKLCKGGKNGRGGRTHQPSQLEASRRRSRGPSTPPVIDDSWSVVVVMCDERSSTGIFFFDGSLQPLAVESMARRTSTRPIVLGEEAVPRNPRTASATGAAATVASRVPMSFE